MRPICGGSRAAADRVVREPIDRRSRPAGQYTAAGEAVRRSVVRLPLAAVVK